MSSFRMPKMTQETLAVASFPKEVQGTLSDAFDKDGDGIIDCQELIEAANLYKQTKATNTLLRKGMVFIAGLSVALVATIGGLTYGIVSASKDTLVEGRALMSKADEPISVSTNEMKLSLATLPFLPKDVTSQVTDVVFTSEDSPFTVHHRKALAIDIIPDEGFKLKTTAGDVLSWHKDDGTEVTIVMEDGTSLVKDAACMECTSYNVFPTEEVLEGVKTFEDVTGLTERRKLFFFGVCR